MNATLFNEARLARIDEAIAANRNEAGDLVPAVLRDDEDAAAQMNRLNEAWVNLLTARVEVGGGDPAPFRMGRS